MTTEDFERILGPLPHPLRVAVAVSGGRDSLSLLFYTQKWIDARGGELVALIVDHGLRPESSDEAAQTASWLRDKNISYEILCWSGVKGTALQQRARQARYDLLLEWCRDYAFPLLLIGHHQQDDFETVIMRMRRQDQGKGLAGMSSRRVFPYTCVIRPFLTTERSILTSFLEGHPFIEDPSNAADCFERVKVRKEGVPSFSLEGQTLDRREQEEKLVDAMVESVRLYPEGYALVQPHPFLAQVLSRVAQMVGGHPYPLALPQKFETVFSLGKTVVYPKKEGFYVVRAQRNLPTIEISQPGSFMWDGRFHVTVLEKMNGYIAPFPKGKGFFQEKVLPSIPALWQNGVCLGFPRGKVVASFEPLEPLAPFFFTKD